MEKTTSWEHEEAKTITKITNHVQKYNDSSNLTMALLWVIQQAQNQPAKQCPNQQRLQINSTNIQCPQKYIGYSPSTRSTSDIRGLNSSHPKMFP